jgi:hypothetical protein
MAAAVSSLLSKVAELKRQAIKQQPVDPLADLTSEQRHFYEQWWDRFRAQHSDRPDALYEAAINYTKWTPNAWLESPKGTSKNCPDLGSAI